MRCQNNFEVELDEKLGLEVTEASSLAVVNQSNAQSMFNKDNLHKFNSKELVQK